jgi:hypothetical protein
MTIGEAPPVDGFRKKVYERMYTDSISLLKADQEKPKKKIIPTSTKSSLREDFKKTFLPLLIDVFELRQRIQNYKAKPTSSVQPKEILLHLEELQKEIEESQRWCEGVILQISKGIEEAKEALQFIEKTSQMEGCIAVKKTSSFWDIFMKKWKK